MTVTKYVDATVELTERFKHIIKTIYEGTENNVFHIKGLEEELNRQIASIESMAGAIETINNEAIAIEQKATKTNEASMQISSALQDNLGKVEGTLDKSTRLKEDMDFFKVN